MKKKILSLLVLLMTAVTGAWAQQKYNVTFSGFDNASCNTTFTDVTLPYSKSFGKTDACSDAYDIDGSSNNEQLVGASFGGDNFTITVKSAFEGTVTVGVSGYNESFDPYSRNITVACVPAAPPFDYTFSVADCDHGTGTVKFFIDEKEVKGAYQADEGKTVTVTVTPDEGWIVDATSVKAESYSTWEAAGARRRSGAPANITILGDITLTKSTTAENTWTFTMPAASVLVSAAYLKSSTLYFDPAKKTDLMKVTVGGTNRNLDAQDNTVKIVKVENVLEGTAVKLTANTGYKFRKVAVKKGEPSPEVGQIIGSDGKNYDANATLPDGVTAVAMIAYVGSDTGVEGYTHGLALALTDEASTMYWTNATGASGAAAHTPAAPTPMTSSWMLPSKDQWTKMINAAGSYTALRNGFSGITGASNLQSVSYWSSTGNTSSDAWGYYFGSGGWRPLDKDRAYQVRACLAF